METKRRLSPEEEYAAEHYGEGIVRRVPTKADVSSIRAVRGKLHAVAAKIEEAGDIPRELRTGLLHDVWKAMDWLPDAFTPGFRRLLERDPK